MQFSTIVILLASTATADLVRRVPAPFTPRSLARRQEVTADCNGLLKQGDVCCGIVKGAANGCAAGQVCANEGDFWWCCPGNTPNCTRPGAECGDNNGGCTEGYECSAGDEGGRGAQCVPVAGTEEAPAAAGEDAPPSEETPPAEAEATQAEATPAVVEETTTAVTTTEETASPDAPPAEGETTATNETTVVTSTETPPPSPAAPESSGNKLTGVSALAFAVMAGVLFL